MIPPPFVNSDFLEKASLAVLSAGLVYVGYFVKARIEAKKRNQYIKADKKMTDGFRSVTAVSASMHAIRHLTSVGRVFLLEVSNSGKVPAPGRIIYARAIDISIDYKMKKGREWHLNTFDETPVDENYIRMVQWAEQTQKGYDFNVANHEPCMLWNIYRELKVKHARIYHVYKDVNEYKHYILSVASFDGMIPEEALPVIENNVAIIRSKFKRYRE